MIKALTALLCPLLVVALFLAPPSVSHADDTLYVATFTTVMVPKAVTEAVFDRFIENMLEQWGEDRPLVLLKEGTTAVDAQWLAARSHVTGELVGYVEESGCCSTVLRIRSRLRLHRPGAEGPLLVADYPRERYFNHDYSTVEEERRRLLADVADTLAHRLRTALATP
jgi:hypothetical protein